MYVKYVVKIKEPYVCPTIGSGSLKDSFGFINLLFGLGVEKFPTFYFFQLFIKKCGINFVFYKYCLYNRDINRLDLQHKSVERHTAESSKAYGGQRVDEFGFFIRN